MKNSSNGFFAGMILGILAGLMIAWCLSDEPILNVDCSICPAQLCWDRQ